MSKDRARRLADLRARMSSSPSPSEVIDHALECALRDSQGLLRRVEDLELASCQASADQALEMARLRDAIGILNESIAALHRLISEVAQGEA